MAMLRWQWFPPRGGVRSAVLILSVVFSLLPAADADAAACSEGSFQCQDGTCIPAAHHCDGYDHCGDEFDEDPASCQGFQPHFICKNGKSIAASAHCNGYDNCNDGSDEDPAECEANTLLVGEGEVVTARVLHNVSRGWIYFTLCDDSSCSSIDVYGTTPRGLKYKTWTTCSRLGAYGCHWSNWGRPPGATPLGTGEHVFLVERRPSEMALWPEERPELAVSVTTKVSFDRLRIRYFRWMRDLPHVEYTGGKVWQPADSADIDAGLNGCGSARFFGPLVSGTLARPEYFPWHGALYEEIDGEYRYRCGASLITPSSLVTAAHCVTSKTANYYVAIGMLTSDWRRDSVGVHKSKVSKVVIHPDFYSSSDSKLDADLALLQLERPAPLSRNIGTLCLPRGNEPAPDDVITVAGWGNGSTALDQLHFAELPYLPRRQCRNVTAEMAKFALGYLTNDKFCSVRDRGVILKGDSGGAAVARRLGVWYLVGIVSSGIDSSRIVVFTNATYGDYADWIEASVRNLTVAEARPEPPPPSTAESPSPSTTASPAPSTGASPAPSTTGSPAATPTVLATT